MSLKIYFAGSIRGGRSERKSYKELIDFLSDFGKVLTEHVGSKELGEFGEKGSDESIFFRDIDWIKECDVFIADVSVPSLGVGYEIAVAENLGKKILCLYRNKKNRKLSAMIKGNPNLSVVYYDDLGEVKENIKAFIDNSLI